MPAVVKRAAGLPLLLVLLLAAVFTLAACGGESKEDFISDADAICRDAEEKTDDVEDPQDVEDIPEWADELIDIAEESKGELEDLDPPSDVEDDFNTYLDNIDEGIELIEDVKDAADAGDEDQVRTAHRDLVRWVDKAAARGALHKNTAARRKARAAALASRKS